MSTVGFTACLRGGGQPLEAATRLPAAVTVASAGGAPRQICTFFAMGGCLRGAACPFSHELTQTAPEGVDATGGFFISGNVANYRPSPSSMASSPASLWPASGAFPSKEALSTAASSATVPASPSTLNPQAKAFQAPHCAAEPEPRGVEAAAPPQPQPQVTVRRDGGASSAIHVAGGADMIATLMRMTAVPTATRNTSTTPVKSGGCEGDSSLGSTIVSQTPARDAQAAASVMQLSSSSCSGSWRSSSLRTNSNVSSTDGNAEGPRHTPASPGHVFTLTPSNPSPHAGTRHEAVPRAVSGGAIHSSRSGPAQPMAVVGHPQPRASPGPSAAAGVSLPAHQLVEAAVPQYEPKYTQSQHTFASGSPKPAVPPAALRQPGAAPDSGSHGGWGPRTPSDRTAPTRRGGANAPATPPRTFAAVPHAAVRVGIDKHVPAPRSSGGSQPPPPPQQRPMPAHVAAPLGKPHRVPAAYASACPQSPSVQVRLTVPPVSCPLAAASLSSSSRLSFAAPPAPPAVAVTPSATAHPQQRVQSRQGSRTSAQSAAASSFGPALPLPGGRALQDQASINVKIIEYPTEGNGALAFRSVTPPQAQLFHGGIMVGAGEGSAAQVSSFVPTRQHPPYPQQQSPQCAYAPQAVAFAPVHNPDTASPLQHSFASVRAQTPCVATPPQFSLAQPPQLQVQAQPQQVFVLTPTDAPGQYALVPLTSAAGGGPANGTNVYVLEGNTLRCLPSVAVVS